MTACPGPAGLPSVENQPKGRFSGRSGPRTGKAGPADLKIEGLRPFDASQGYFVDSLREAFELLFF